jgi:hypothetical protein
MLVSNINRKDQTMTSYVNYDPRAVEALKTREEMCDAKYSTATSYALSNGGKAFQLGVSMCIMAIPAACILSVKNSLTMQEWKDFKSGWNSVCIVPEMRY